MFTILPRRRVWASASAVLLALVCFLQAPGHGQQPDAAGDKAKAKDSPQPLYFGATVCAGCHALAKPEDVRGLPPILCRCNESLTWDKEDKHKLAYTNVFKPGGRGEQMVKLLNYTAQDVQKNCVVCHGVYVSADKLDTLTDKTFKRDQSEGVTCVACHGAYSDWVDPHGSFLNKTRENWRKLTRQVKEQKYGMTDLWDPVKRTRMCATCHIGDLQEGKVVTHTMYAAGHPPLPGLEISTFSDEMPRHWEYLYEKKGDAPKLLQYNPAVLERTQLVVLGGLVELEESMNLLAGQAERCTQAKDPDDRALDLASFDCYACHHDLKTKSWRQARGYSGKPGRPQFRPWPTALIMLAIHQADGDSELGHYQQFEKRLRAAFDAQPFGKPDEVASAARDLQKWCKQLEGKLSQSPGKFDQSAALRLLQYLCMLTAAEAPDYDSARQMAWAFRIIYDDLKPKPPNDAAIQAKLKELSQELKLDLPSTQKREILVELSDVLTRIASYEPGSIRKRFGELSTLLGKQ